MLPMPRKKSKRTRRMVTYRLHEDLLDQLDKLTEQSRRTATAEIELALEFHLKQSGLWPIVDSQKEPSEVPTAKKPKK